MSLSCRSLLVLAFLLGGPIARADDDEPRPIFGAHPGYLFNVVDEKDRREVEMVMLEPPKDDKKPISKIIFDEKLSKEFQDQYRYRFGETQAEQILNNPARDDAYTYYNTQSVTVQDYQRYQSQFAQYMGRRLVEYHFDNFFRNDRTLRPIYEAKDRFSNLNVEVKQGWKLNWKYNFAGPSMEVTVDNPYKLEIKLQMMMSGIISAPNDYVMKVGRQLTPRIHVEALYKSAEQLSQVVGTRKMTKHISMSLTASSGYLPPDAVATPIYQNLALLGLTWSE